MGIIADLGIRLWKDVDNDIRRVTQRFGFMPVSWDDVKSRNPSRDFGLMWRIPDPAVESASILTKVQAIIVRENEHVLVLRDGRLEGEEAILPPGFYTLQRTQAVFGSIEVVWLTKGEIHFPWGVGDVTMQDGYTIGASGNYRVAIVNPYNFLMNVRPPRRVYTEDEFLEFARDSVNGAINHLMADQTVMRLQRAQPEIEEACREKLRPIFEKWGLEFLGLSIESKKIPQEALDLIKLERTIDRQNVVTVKEAEVGISLAQIEMQKAQFAALAEANRRLLLGNAETQVMQGQMGIGLNPLELQTIEAMKILAANPGEGMLMDNRLQIINQLQQPMQMPVPQPPPAVAANVPPALTAPAAQPASSEPMSRAKIDEMLDKLDERFANGEISEQVYLTMQSKWQKRLDQI